MIVVKLMGGLGNQMFQYAIGRRISLFQKTNLKADESFLKDTGFNHIQRKFELDVFSASIPIATEEELSKFTDVQKSKLKKGVQKILPFASSYYTIRETGHQYNAHILNAPTNSHLIGFWQTEKYFLPIQDIIREDFTFKAPLTGLNKTHAENIAASNSVSMHIRRGDYITNPQAAQFHGNCTPEYYYTGLKLIQEKTSNIHLFIFSDDIEWVKTNMHFDIPVTYIDNNIDDKSYIDMQLMSLCRHNIIANSSFSWWGAWLNANRDKIVVAPAKWFNDTSINVTDVIPETWHKL